MSGSCPMQPLSIFVLSVLVVQAYGYCLPALRKFSSTQTRGSTSTHDDNLYQALHLDASSLRLTKEEELIANTARLAAWRAGEVILAGLGSIDSSHGIESKIGSRDIVTKVDKESQEIIRNTILTQFPQHTFLGEEDIPPGIEASATALEKFKHEAHLWIVDPVDGTTNFAHGMPLCAVIIAYASFGVVKHGFIYDPFRQESFVAWQGKGAYLNGRKLHCSKIDRMDSSVVCTGSPPNLQSLSASLRSTELLSPKVRSMRVLGSAAVHLSWLSAGRIEAYFEADLNAWDLAAGALIIQEAGGKVTDVWGNAFELSTRNCVASNGLIHADLLADLVQAKMWI